MVFPRLVISMPPATPHMDKLAVGTSANLPSPLPLYAVVWAPRAENKKVFNPWLKDSLVKQGMYTQVIVFIDRIMAPCQHEIGYIESQIAKVRHYYF